MPDADTSPPQAARASLSQRVLRAGSWVLAGHVLSQVLRLGSNLILARLLAPDDFGLMQVGYMVLTGLHLFSDMGLWQSVVRSPHGEESRFLHTAWTVHVVRGFILAIVTLLLALALYIADVQGWTPPHTVYNDPRLPWVIAAFAAMAIIIGLGSMRASLAERHLQQRLLARNELVAQILTLTAMVAVAWYTRSFVALVVGALLSAGIKTWMSHYWLPGPPDRLGIDRPALQELIQFGKWVFVSSIIGYLASNADRLLLGLLIDGTSFGLYSVAFQFANVMQVVGGMLGAKLAFSALSEVHRERDHDLPRVLVRLQWAYDALIVTGAAMLAVAGPTVVGLLYDHRYDAAGWMLSALAVSVIGGRTQIVEHLCNAIGRPSYNTWQSGLRLVGTVGCILIGHRIGGLHGAVWGVAVGQFVPWPLAWWIRHHHGMGVWRSDWLLLPTLTVGLGLGWALVALIGLVKA